MVSYYYDGKNRRVKKDLTSGTDVLYINHGWQELEEREWDTNGEGTEDDKWEPRRQYVYGPTYVDEVLIFDKDTDSDGDCTDGEGSSRYFYAQQANWNVVAVTDSSGDTAERIKYDPYGEAAVAVQAGHSSTGNPYLFQGRRWDSEAGLYYFRNRVMSPALGRLLQRDPAGYLNGFGLYEFAGSAAPDKSDPSGLGVDCPEGRWWVTGTIGSGQVALGYGQASLKYECMKRKKVGEWIYRCDDGKTVVRQSVYEVPTARGGMRMLLAGLGIQASRGALVGEAWGTPNSDDFTSRWYGRWGGGSSGIALLIVAASARIGPGGQSLQIECGWKALGLNLVSTSWRWTKIWTSEMTIHEERLGKAFRLFVADPGCTKSYQELPSPTWEDNPKPEVKGVTW